MWFDWLYTYLVIVDTKDFQNQYPESGASLFFCNFYLFIYSTTLLSPYSKFSNFNLSIYSTPYSKLICFFFSFSLSMFSVLFFSKCLWGRCDKDARMRYTQLEMYFLFFFCRLNNNMMVLVGTTDVTLLILRHINTTQQNIWGNGRSITKTNTVISKVIYCDALVVMTNQF